jgi:hypothetical protein
VSAVETRRGCGLWHFVDGEARVQVLKENKSEALLTQLARMGFYTYVSRSTNKQVYCKVKFYPNREREREMAK